MAVTESAEYQKLRNETIVAEREYDRFVSSQEYIAARDTWKILDDHAKRLNEKVLSLAKQQDDMIKACKQRQEINRAKKWPQTDRITLFDWITFAGKEGGLNMQEWFTVTGKMVRVTSITFEDGSPLGESVTGNKSVKSIRQKVNEGRILRHCSIRYIETDVHRWEYPLTEVFTPRIHPSE